jgi:hypothetical protein
MCAIKVGHIHYFTKQLALSLLNESGYRIIDASYTRAVFTAPSRSWKMLIARPFRRLIYALFGKDRGVRLVGGETLIVLAQSQASYRESRLSEKVRLLIPATNVHLRRWNGSFECSIEKFTTRN